MKTLTLGRLNRLALLLLAIGVLATHAATRAGASELDSIEYWIGQGANEAALAIDWDGASAADTALVWGYRWDGDAAGEQLLRDVVAADSRLFARVGSVGGLGVAVYGLGYDANNDAEFAIDQPGVTFGPDGLAVTDADDGGLAVDPADRYREGWFEGFWHYGVGVDAAGAIAWQTSQTGLATRSLAAGEWHSLAFAVTADYTEFAQNLQPAEPPTPALPGDFNGDNRVDAADFTVWRDNAAPIEDYLAWKQSFGVTADAALTGDARTSDASTAAPEPSLLGGLIAATSVLACASDRRVSRQPPIRS